MKVAVQCVQFTLQCPCKFWSLASTCDPELHCLHMCVAHSITMLEITCVSHCPIQY